MAKKTTSKTYDVPTTNFIIHLDKIDKVSLSLNYQLLTIELPDTFRYFAKSNKKYYEILHNTYKEQLEMPYYFFSRAKPKSTIYILIEKTKDKGEPIALTFDFLGQEPIFAQRKDVLELCTDEKLHILAKLFLADYFYNHKKTYRICQAKFYIDSNIFNDKATVLKVDISKTKGSSEFQIKPEATYLLKTDKKYLKSEYLSSDAYCELLQGEKYYRQVKTSFVESWRTDEKNTKELWKVENDLDRKKNNKRKMPSIKWFEDYDNITRCKSTLLQEFQDKLVKHYNQTLGKGSTEKQKHKMTNVEPIKQFAIEGYGKNTGLYLKFLNKIGLLDLRFKEVQNANPIPFQQYVDFFNNHYAEHGITFSEICKEELSTNQKAILVLQDVEKSLFEDKDEKKGIGTGFLFEKGFFDDPKQQLYRQFATKIALQTMNINTNQVEDCDAATYFDYEMLGECIKPWGNSFDEIKENLNTEEKEIKELYKNEKENQGEVSDEAKERRKYNEKLKKHLSLITNKIDVCLNELLLKYYIVNQLPIKSIDNPNQCLPCLLSLPKLVAYAYMHQNFLMYVDNASVLQFIDLQDRKGKDQRGELLKNWGIDWLKIDNDFSIRNYTRKNGKDETYTKNGEVKNKHEEDLKKTHFVFAKDLVLAIEDTEERVLHKYDPEKKGTQRKGEYKTALEGIYFSEEQQLYTVGYKSLDITADDSVKVRKLHYYQKPENFKVDDLLKTLAVQFVRNQQYTVYPYFFDLLRLYQKDILLK